MKFSIVTVCYNSAAVLPRAIQSLEGQTCVDAEWVVVDGASKDGTLQLVHAFHGFSKTVLSEPDKGIYDAMNKAVQLCKGDYLYFLNSDDALIDATVLQDVQQALERQGNPDLLLCNVLYVKKQGTVLRRFKHITATRIFFDSLCHQAVFIKRSLAVSVGPFDTSLKMSADYEWFIRAFKAGARTAYFDRVVAKFSADGAHIQQNELTRNENVRAREMHASESFLHWMGRYYSLLYHLRRAVGLQAVGHYPQ